MAENEDITKRPPDPFVAARINDPKAGPPATLTLVGLLGDSDRPGRRRLYLNTRLDYWVEVRTEDVLAVEDVGPDQPPFQGLDATRLTVARDAALDYVRTAVAGASDPFSVQPMTAMAQPMAAFAATWEAECPGPTREDCPSEIGCPTAFECPSGWTVCKPRTCRETQGVTCDTCRHTCDTCHGGTCRTCGDCPTRNDATCITCANTCANTCAATCANTCANTCGVTCITCPTGCAATCGPTCITCPTGCAATCGPTCGATCAGTCGATCRFTCSPDLCETVGRCPTVLQTHCNTCRC